MASVAERSGCVGHALLPCERVAGGARMVSVGDWVNESFDKED